MSVQIDDFCSLMELEEHGPDVYVGTSPEYPWGRVYGGQVVAQALRARDGGQGRAHAGRGGGRAPLLGTALRAAECRAARRSDR